ncbi:MAG: acyl-CoA dehydrogenase C-terminal domain-containing protein, partial [Burkholderiaceae bacterium]
TTAIQANDLIGRKTSRDGGATAKRFIEEMRQTAGELEQAGGDCGVIAARLRTAVDAYAEVVEYVVRAFKDDVRAVYAGSVPYLKLAGIVHGGWQMGRAALAATRHLAAGDDPDFYRAKIATARFFADHMLITVQALAATAAEGSAGTLALADEQF